MPDRVSRSCRGAPAKNVGALAIIASSDGKSRKITSPWRVVAAVATEIVSAHASPSKPVSISRTIMRHFVCASAKLRLPKAMTNLSPEATQTSFGSRYFWMAERVTACTRSRSSLQRSPSVAFSRSRPMMLTRPAWAVPQFCRMMSLSWSRNSVSLAAVLGPRLRREERRLERTALSERRAGPKRRATVFPSCWTICPCMPPPRPSAGASIGRIATCRRAAGMTHLVRLGARNAPRLLRLSTR